MNSTFGPRRMPRLSAAMAPLGGGSLASSSVISCAARASPKVRRLAAMHPSHIVFANRLLKFCPPRYLVARSTNAAIADDRVRRPEQRMCVGEFRFAFAIEIAGAV